MDARFLPAFLLLNAWIAVAFKPVIFMHGILAGPDESQDSFDFIKEEHPGTQLYTIDAFNYQESLQPMWKQVDFVGIQMLKIMALYPAGVHLICFSQGGLLCRAVLEKYPHNVDTFISLSAPQAGQFGDTNFLKDLFPNFIKNNLYKILYSPEGQKVSIGNYWNGMWHAFMLCQQRPTKQYSKSQIHLVTYPEVLDHMQRLKNFPIAKDERYLATAQEMELLTQATLVKERYPHHQEMYQNYSNFLAVLNNQTSNPDSQEFKSNFLCLKHMVMIGGPDDGVITPWQSSHFGFYNSAEEIVEMEAQKWYINDLFGLQTLDKRKGLNKYVIPGVQHIHWHTNRTVFDCCIEPWLT